MKNRKLLLLIAVVVLIAAGCTSFPMTSSGGPVTGGSCGVGNGSNAWPQQQPEHYPMATRDGVANTGIGDTNTPSDPSWHLGNGYDTYGSTTGGLNIEPGGTIQSCTGADNYVAGSPGTGDGLSNFGVIAQLDSGPGTCGGCIQAYPKHDQGFNNFNRSNGFFDGNPNATATPVADITHLISTWNMPTGTTTINGTTYNVNDLNNGDWEQAYDIWHVNSCGNSGNAGDSDVMLWTATSAQRRAETYGGMSGSKTSQTPIHNNNFDLGGSLGTVNVDWGYFGNELVFALHTNVMSGSVDLVNIFNLALYLQVWKDCTTGPPLSISNVDLGWELARTSVGGSPWTTQGAQAFQEVDFELLATTVAG